MNEITKVETGPLTIHTAPDISDLMRLAIDKGADGVDALEKLVSLRERIEDRNARHAFHEALMNFQSACPPIYKSEPVDFVSKRTGTKVKYNYAPLDKIWVAIHPHLAPNGLSVTWDAEDGGGKTTSICTVHHVAGHSKSSRFTCPLTKDNAIMSDAQSTGAANKYAMRNALILVLGLITTDDDTDGADENALDPISEDDVLDLEKLLSDTGADKGKFLAVFGVERLEDIPKVQLSIATGLLQQKRRKA